MEMKYNITGDKRKALVGAVSQELNAPIKYLGAPTFVYEVGGYHIDKNATVTGPDNLDLAADLQALHGFEAVERNYDEPDESELEPDRLVVEMPLSSFTEEAISKLLKLVDSKANLIKKAIGSDNLQIEQTESTLRFPWFVFDASPDKVKAYTHFISALCDMAKSLHRVKSEPKEVDNVKYAFRCFLLRLGFIGEEYKAECKILLKNLEGNSAFKQNSSKAVKEDA